MSPASPSYLRGLVTEPGAGTFDQSALAARMRGRLQGRPGADAALALVDTVYARSGIRRRHLEVPLDTEGAGPGLHEPALGLARRALRRLFDAGDVSPIECDGLIAVVGDAETGPLAVPLARALHFPDNGVHQDLVSSDGSGPAQAIFLAQMLLRRGACDTVCVVAVDVTASAAEVRPLPDSVSVAELMGRSLASDGAAALVLSRQPGRAPRLAWRDCTLATRVWPRTLREVSGAEAVHDRVLAELRAWLARDRDPAPVFLCPGGPGLLRRIHDRHPDLAPSTAPGRRVMESHGLLPGTSVLWVLDGVLREPLADAFRLFTLGPGVAVTVLSIEGVVPHAPA